MATEPTVPETALALVRSYCDRKVEPELRDQLRIECEAEGRDITIYESRPPWSPDVGPDWTRIQVARLRYLSTKHEWRLYALDSNGRWHAYETETPTTRLEELLREVDDDPTGIFWG